MLSPLYTSGPNMAPLGLLSKSILDVKTVCRWTICSAIMIARACDNLQGHIYPRRAGDELSISLRVQVITRPSYHNGIFIVVARMNNKRFHMT